MRAWKLNRRRAELARELDAALEDAAAAANRGEEEKTTPTRARGKKQPLVVRAGKPSTDARRSARVGARNGRDGVS